MLHLSNVGHELRGWPPAIRRLWSVALDLLFAPTCVGCGQEGAYVCETCRASLPVQPDLVCPKCARPLDAYGACGPCSSHPLRIDGITAAFRMEGVARDMVHRLKYDNLRAIAPQMASLMAQHIGDTTTIADVVVPVPLHPKRERSRGYNQALLLARGIAASLSLPLETRSLRRLKDTPAQARLDHIETRRANISGAFQARDVLEGRRVLLVDDVCTTGATLEACALALAEAGAAEVWGLVFAR